MGEKVWVVGPSRSDHLYSREHRRLLVQLLWTLKYQNTTLQQNQTNIFLYTDSNQLKPSPYLTRKGSEMLKPVPNSYPPHRKHCCQPTYHTAVVKLYHYLSTLPCNTLPWCQTSISAHNEWMSSFLYYNLNTFCNYMKAWIHGVHAHLCKLTPSWTYSNPPK